MRDDVSILQTGGCPPADVTSLVLCHAVQRCVHQITQPSSGQDAGLHLIRGDQPPQAVSSQRRFPPLWGGRINYRGRRSKGGWQRGPRASTSRATSTRAVSRPTSLPCAWWVPKGPTRTESWNRGVLDVGAVMDCRCKAIEIMARETGLEPATSGVTGRRSNQLSYSPAVRSASFAPRLGGCGIKARVASSQHENRTLAENVCFSQLRAQMRSGQGPSDLPGGHPVCEGLDVTPCLGSRVQLASQGFRTCDEFADERGVRHRRDVAEIVVIARSNFRQHATQDLP